jgi:uncharacterized protein (TIGR03437 family)
MKGFLHSVSVIAILALGGALAAYSQTPVIDPSRASLSSASFATGQAVAPGSLVSIFGTNFASSLTVAGSIPLSTSLANIQVKFNGIAAPIGAVISDPTNGDQINVQMPWEILPLLPPGTNGTVQVVVTRNNVASASQNVTVAPAAPGIFAILLSGGVVVGSGHGQAIAYGNSDGIIAAPAGAITGLPTHPAKINDPLTLAILATGLGQVNPPMQTGNNVTDGQVHPTVVTPTVMVGGVPAQVIFSGMTPQFVGVYQINIIIAPGTPTGDAVPLQIQMNGVKTADNVTIAVSN